VTTVSPPVDFVASIALEVRTSPSTGPFIRFHFKNGTNDPSYTTYGIMGSASGDVPLQTFIDNLSPIGIENLPEWCSLCGNDYSRGCQFLGKGNVNADAKGLRWSGDVSPVGAGLLGAGLTVFVAGVLVAIGVLLGIVRIGRKKPVRRAPSNASSGDLNIVVCTRKHRVPCPKLTLRRLTVPWRKGIGRTKAGGCDHSYNCTQLLM
jgi:hypothetical protein